MQLSEGKKKHLKALSDSRGVIAAAAWTSAESPKVDRSGRRHRRKQSHDEMMSEFKTAVTRILTPHASAILLDPEWAFLHRSPREERWLLLAYEKTGTTRLTRAASRTCCRTCLPSASKILAATLSKSSSTTRL